MKGENTLLGHEIVHDTEEALLHLTSILCPKNNHLSSPKVKVYTCRRCHIMCVSITWKASSVVNREIWGPKVLHLFWSRPNAPVITYIYLYIPLHIVFYTYTYITYGYMHTHVHSYMDIHIFIYTLLHIHTYIYIDIMHMLQSHIHTH